MIGESGTPGEGSITEGASQGALAGVVAGVQLECMIAAERLAAPRDIATELLLLRETRTRHGGMEQSGTSAGRAGSEVFV